MSLKVILITILLLFICLNISCSNSGFPNGIVVPKAQKQKLHQQIKASQFEQIYVESAEVLQSGISKEIFVIRMTYAVGKMKEIEPTFSFQESNLSEILSPLINDKNWVTSFEKIEKDNKRLEFLTQWAKDNNNNSFKLAGLSIIEPIQDGRSKIYFVEREKESVE